VSNPAHSLVTLLDPFESGGVRLVCADQPAQLEQFETFLLATGIDALLMKGTEGEPYANPKQRPRIKYFRQGEITVLFEEENAVGTRRAEPSGRHRRERICGME
jgi:anthranilate phosphoribosyltransferase